MFVTLLYCCLDLKSASICYSRAGHLPPIVVTKGGEIIELPVTQGVALGMFKEINIDKQQFTIPEGGLALFFSDGLYEAFNPQGQAFGLDRVKDILVTHRHEKAKAICNKLWMAVQEFSGENLHQDDFTAVIIKRV